MTRFGGTDGRRTVDDFLLHPRKSPDRVYDFLQPWMNKPRIRVESVICGWHYTMLTNTVSEILLPGYQLSLEDDIPIGVPQWVASLGFKLPAFKCRMSFSIKCQHRFSWIIAMLKDTTYRRIEETYIPTLLHKSNVGKQLHMANKSSTTETGWWFHHVFHRCTRLKKHACQWRS